jgi:hypothetical protein
VTHCEGKFVAIKNRVDINRLVQDLLNDRPRRDLLAEVEENGLESVSPEACENSLNLAARLLVMVAIGAVKD